MIYARVILVVLIILILVYYAMVVAHLSGINLWKQFKELFRLLKRVEQQLRELNGNKRKRRL